VRETVSSDADLRASTSVRRLCRGNGPAPYAISLIHVKIYQNQVMNTTGRHLHRPPRSAVLRHALGERGLLCEDRKQRRKPRRSRWTYGIARNRLSQTGLAPPYVSRDAVGTLRSTHAHAQRDRIGQRWVEGDETGCTTQRMRHGGLSMAVCKTLIGRCCYTPDFPHLSLRFESCCVPWRPCKISSPTEEM